MSHQNNQHAARLREMAHFEQSKAEEWEKHATSLVTPCGYSHRGCAKAAETCRVTAAALLAGAEALEAVEVAKAALQKVAEDMEAHMDMGQNHAAGLLTWGQMAFLKSVAAYCVAALARLEGK